MPIYVHRNGQQMGPYEPKQVLDMLRDGSLSPEDMGIEQGGTAWQKLGEIFPGVGVQRPSSGAPIAAVKSDSEPSRSKAGCLKGALLGLGILMLLLGIGVAAGSRFIPSTSCQIVESDEDRIDKLRSDLDRAAGKFDEQARIRREIDSTISGLEASRRYCDNDRFRNNMITAAGGAAAFIGLLMSVLGLFVGRKK